MSAVVSQGGVIVTSQGGVLVYTPYKPDLKLPDISISAWDASKPFKYYRGSAFNVTDRTGIKIGYESIGDDIQYRYASQASPSSPWTVIDYGQQTPTDRLVSVTATKGLPKQVIWDVKNDGSAIYNNQYYNSETKTFNGFKIVYDAGLRNYNFSKEGFDTFKMVASFYPNGFLDYSYKEKGELVIPWEYPFSSVDKEKWVAWVNALQPIDAFGLYYTLAVMDGADGDCHVRKAHPELSFIPREYFLNGFWKPFQTMLLMSIYDIRTDLRRIKDPETGKVIEGLIDYREFKIHCDTPLWVKIVGGIAIIGLGMFSGGASLLIQAAIKVSIAAKDILATVDKNTKARRAAEFQNRMVIGYNAAQNYGDKYIPANSTEREPLTDAQGLVERGMGAGTGVGAGTGAGTGAGAGLGLGLGLGVGLLLLLS